MERQDVKFEKCIKIEHEKTKFIVLNKLFNSNNNYSRISCENMKLHLGYPINLYKIQFNLRSLQFVDKISERSLQNIA